MKISNNLSNIQTMVRESVEKVLISFTYNSKGSPGFSKKFWIARMSALVRAGGKNLFKNSFRMSSQVEIELGASERNLILAFSFRENGNNTIQIIWRGDPVERKALQTSSKSLMNE